MVEPLRWPGPQTARTVDPLGGKGPGAVHRYQIMAAPSRHPTQNLAALGALQYLLNTPADTASNGIRISGKGSWSLRMSYNRLIYGNIFGSFGVLQKNTYVSAWVYGNLRLVSVCAKPLTILSKR